MPKSPFYLFFYSIVLMLAITFQCDAQPTIRVKDYAFERSYWHKQTLQTKPDELTIIYGRSDWFFYSSRLFIRRHSLSDSTTTEKKLDLTANHQPAYLINAFTHDTSIYFVCAVAFSKKSDMGWCVLRYNRIGTFTTVIEPQVVNALPQNVLLHGDMYSVTSSDNGKAAVCFSWTGVSGTMEKVYALTFDLKNPQHFQTTTLTVHNPITHYEHQKFMLDEKGSLYSLGKQYIDGTSEVLKGQANYAYVVTKATDSAFKLQCTIPPDRIVRSFKSLLKNDTLYGTALISDTTLSLHDSLLMMRMRVSDGSLISYNVSPIVHPPVNTHKFQNRFENNISFLDDNLLSLFELQHIDYNESAKSGNGFTYERGAAIAVVIDKNDSVKKITNVLKWQQFDNMASLSLHPFAYNDDLYVAHISDQDDVTRSSALNIGNLNSGSEKKFALSYVDWQKAEPYELFVTPKGLVGFQSHSRRYTLFTVPIR